MFNDLFGKRLEDLDGLIALGETTADIAVWLDVSEAYVTARIATLAATAASVIALAEADAAETKAVVGRQTMAADPLTYVRASLPAVKGLTVAADRRTISLVSSSVKIGSAAAATLAAANKDLNTAGNWDTTSPTNYTVAATRAGVWFYIYAIAAGFIISAAADAPSGYTSADSRKIGGFFCLRLAIGTVVGNQISGFIVGDIHPGTIWDVDPTNSKIVEA